MPMPAPDEQIRFLVKIQRLLGEGRFVASYKFALLQALSDLAVEKGDDSGEPLRLTTTDIAGKFIQYYWRQSLPMAAPHLDTPSILKQNKGRQAAVVNKVAGAREAADNSLTRAMANPRLWNPLVSEVAEVVRVMPLWKLQTIGQETDDFLYPNLGTGNIIELRPGVACCLRKFHELIQDLIRGGWVRYIRSIGTNQGLLGETTDLREFLFGSERENLGIFRGFLQDIQSGDCFYCRDRIRGPGEVDHFIPWVRYPVDLGHNFVLAHAYCNRHKRDYLAAEHHLERWIERNLDREADLQQFFGDRGIMHDLESSSQITCWAYQQATSSRAHVWVLKKQTRPIGTYWQNYFRGAGKSSLMAAERGSEYE